MAIEFDDANSDGLIAVSLIANPPITVSAWFRSDDASINQRVFALHGAGPQTHECRLNGGSNTISAVSQNLNGVSATTTATWSANQWHHGLWTLASSARSATLDGGTTASNTETRIPTLTSTSISAGNSPFSGRIAELAVWDADLSAIGDFARIKRALALGFAPLKVRPANLVAWFRFEGGEIDDCIGRFAMSVTGTPGSAPHPRIWGIGRPAMVLGRRRRIVSLGGIYVRAGGRVVLAG